MGYGIGRNYQPIWVSVSDRNQNSGFGRTLRTWRVGGRPGPNPLRRSFANLDVASEARRIEMNKNQGMK